MERNQEGRGKESIEKSGKERNEEGKERNR